MGITTLIMTLMNACFDTDTTVTVSTAVVTGDEDTNVTVCASVIEASPGTIVADIELSFKLVTGTAGMCIYNIRERALLDCYFTVLFKFLCS